MRVKTLKFNLRYVFKIKLVGKNQATKKYFQKIKIHAK